jgi:hypothetical protein
MKTVTNLALQDALNNTTAFAEIKDIFEYLEGPGNRFFVNSVSGNDNFEGSRDAPLATIDAANNTALAGDTVIVSSSHVETISNATSIVPDIAGITFIGLGRGARRPTITFDNTASNIPISGAGVTFKNFLFVTSGTVDVTAGVTVTAADVLLEDIEMRESASDSQWVDAVVITTGGDRCKAVNFIHRGHASGNANAAGISITAALDGCEIIAANIDGLHSAGCIENVTAACTNLVIDRPFLRNRHATQDACIAVVATATGFIIDPKMRTATNDAGGFNAAITATNDMQVYNPLVVNLDGEVGAAWGTASNNT